MVVPDPPKWLENENLIPTDVFTKLFGNNFERILEETQQYANTHGNTAYKLSLSTVKCAIGVLILSGYNRLPSRRNYWEEQSDVRNSLVAQNIQRNTFETFLQYLHVADPDNLPQGNKVGRIHDYLEELKKNFRDNCI